MGGFGKTYVRRPILANYWRIFQFGCFIGLTFNNGVHSQGDNSVTLPPVLMEVLGRPTSSALIPTFQNSTHRLNTRYVFTEVLNDAYTSSGTDGVKKAQRFSYDLSNNVEYTTKTMENFIETIGPVSGTSTICIPRSTEDLLNRCSEAYEYGDSVYIPLTKVDQDNLNISAATTGELGKAEKQTKAWFNAIRDLKHQVPKLKIYALFIGQPSDDLLHSSLEELRRVVDGVLIDSEYTPGACWSNVKKPPPNRNWLWFVKEVRYLVSNLDPTECVIPDSGVQADKEPYTNSSRGLPIPDFIRPIFPCYGGREWRCYDAIKNNPAEACQVNQRYAFSLYEFTSAAVLKLLTNTCTERVGKVPPYDLVKTL